MRASSYILLACIALACSSRAEAQVRVQMTADRTEVALTDNVVVQIAVQTQSSEQPRIEVPDFDSFQVVQRAVQRPMSFSFGFGQNAPTVTSSTNYTFVLQPVAAGRFQIAPVRVTVGGKTYASQGLTIVVRAPTGQPGQPGQPSQPQAAPGDADATAQANAAAAQAQAAGDAAVFDGDAFLRTVIDKTEPYVGEQVTATIYLYTRRNLQQMPAIRAEPSTDGFWIHDLLSENAPPEPSRQLVNGRAFWVYVLRRFAAFPLRSGELTLGAMSLTITRESIFDLLDPGRAQPSLDRSGVPLTLRVKPLPDAGKPSTDVAVGKLQLTAALDRTQAATGDAITLTATVRGTGNLEAVRLPSPVVPGLDVLQPETHAVVEAPNDVVSGTRSFAWLIVPRAPGTYAIPPLVLDTFDPQRGQYQRLESAPLTLTAAGNPPQAAAAPTVEPHTPDPEQGTEGDGERWPTLRTKSRLLRRTTPLASHPLYLLALGCAPLLWLGSVLVPATRRRFAARAGAAARSGQREAEQRLRRAEVALHAAQPSEFHAELAAALTQLVSAKLEDNIAGLTRSEARSVLSERGLERELVSELLDVLERCEAARFSPGGSDPSEMQRLHDRAAACFAKLSAFTPAPRAEANA